MPSHVRLFATTPCHPMGCSLPGSSVLGIFPGKNTGAIGHFLLQGVFLTQGSNPSLWHLLHWRADFLPLSHLGSLSLGVAIFYPWAILIIPVFPLGWDHSVLYSIHIKLATTSIASGRVGRIMWVAWRPQLYKSFLEEVGLDWVQRRDMASCTVPTSISHMQLWWFLTFSLVSTPSWFYAVFSLGSF